MVVIQKYSETYIKILTDDQQIVYELSDLFSYKIDNYQFHPKVKARVWDGVIRLFSPKTRLLYLGLHPYVKEYCEKNGYEYQYEGDIDQEESFSVKEFEDLVKSLKLSVNNNGKRIDITPYEHQQKAVIHAIQARRSLLLSATSSGKSHILYLLLQYYLKKKFKKILIIVPNTNLVKQLYDDFSDYSHNISWDASKKCHLIYDGEVKITNKPVTITTWQALAVKERPPKDLTPIQKKKWSKTAPYILQEDYFEQFDVVFFDEVHLAAAEQATNILTKTINAKYRIGTTGTLKESKTNQMVLEGLFGQVYQAVTTKQLMDNKQAANLSVNCLLLQYNDEERKLVSKMDYQKEINFLVSHQRRNEFITNLTLSLKGNTMVVFQYVDKHGKILHDLLKEKVDKNRKLFYVYGKTETEERDLVKKITEGETDAIIVCSVATFGTGVSIRNIDNIISVFSTKSKVWVLQPIGRGLRLSSRKDSVNYYDVVDDLTHKNKPNYVLKHFMDRIKFYISEQFSYKSFKIKV